MNHPKLVSRPVLALFVLLFSAAGAVACSCPSSDDTVLGNFETARFVFVARAASVKLVPKTTVVYHGTQETKETEMVVKSTKWVVERVYKGNLRLGAELTFGQDDGPGCKWKFDETVVGNEFLFYLNPKESVPTVWYAEECGRTAQMPGSKGRMVLNAADDLAYLEQMKSVLGKTRISGTLISYQWSPATGGAVFTRRGGNKIRLIGEKGTYETSTNADGVYELYDLPPGRYRIEPTVPRGWRIEPLSGWGSAGSDDREADLRSEVTVRPGRHAYFNFFFQVDNRFRARILTPAGEPMENVCVDLLPAQGEVSKHFRKTGCSNADGNFEINEIPFGNYVLAVNQADKISPYRPFHKFYYPNAADPKNATVIAVNEGEDPAPITIRIPETKETVVIRGVFLTADSKPVTGAWIRFVPEANDESVDGGASDVTDEQGRFTIKLLKGIPGKLEGEAILNNAEFSGCPELVAQIKERKPVDWSRQTSNTLELTPVENLDGVELRLFFPACNERGVKSLLRID